MSDQAAANIEFQEIRKLAMRKLQQYGKGESDILERYLFAKDFLIGLRYEAGPFCFLWKSSENFAKVLRGDTLIENVATSPSTEERRVA